MTITSGFNIPLRVTRLQENFSKKYEEQKPDKRLHWVHQMGSVTITVELKDRTLSSITVTPLEAAVIELFSQIRE
jgi:anaphase-promoting complex subunit 2